MVYVRRIWTRSGARFTLRNMDNTSSCYKYFRTIGQTRKYAEEIGKIVIN
jgi:hypothetical protein